MGSLGVLGNTEYQHHIIMSNSLSGGDLVKHYQPPSSAGTGVDQSKLDWDRYGLETDEAVEKKTTTGTRQGRDNNDDEDDGFHRDSIDPCRDNDLFAEDKSLVSKPWWKANFFVSEPILFGVWDGVFTSIMINTLSVIVFLRSGWMVAQAGIWLSLLVIIAAVSVVLIAALAAIGICTRCHVERGGVYFIISHVLGARFGGAIGLLYCLGQAAGAAIHIIGFGESMAQMFRLENIWMGKLIGIVVLLILIGINLFGVIWVIKVQFILLITLLLATLDFTVGSFIHVDLNHGVDGYNSYNFWNNSGAAYSEGDSWFTVFGVFFPSVSGILAGINMSGDLHNPSRDIPIGTLSALGVSSIVYMIFVLVLGATCQRWALRTDFMITEKVSALGFVLLAGLYTASLSSCLGGLYSAPRILQRITSENLQILQHWKIGNRGSNEVPVFATLVVGTVTLAFAFVGDINTLAPLVAMPFLLAYAATDYAYFSLSMTFDLQRKRDEYMRQRGLLSDPAFDKTAASDVDRLINVGSHYGSTIAVSGKQPIKESDLDTLFPERTKHRSPLKRQYSSQTSSIVSSPDEQSEEGTDKDAKSIESADSCVGITDLSQLIPKGGFSTGISRKSQIWYQALSNRWVSLFGVLVNLFIMFLVNWIFALVTIVGMWLVYFYISRTNPGAPTGISEFKMLPWLKHFFLRLIGRDSREYTRVVVTPMHPGLKVMAAQLTEDNVDYATRDRYHQSAPHRDSRLDAFEDD